MQRQRQRMQLRNKPYPGLFLTVEGGDGCGKTTVAQKIVSYLQGAGYQVVATREPGGSALSEHIREMILQPSSKMKIGPRAELLLFLAARSQHVEEMILPALREGKIVVCERFHDSTIAYQGMARHLGMAFVEELARASCDCIDPDCTFFLDIDPVEGLKRVKEGRGEKDRLEQEKLQFHREVRQGFLHLADKYRDRIAIIDASLPIDEVAAVVLKALEPHLTAKK